MFRILAGDWRLAILGMAVFGVLIGAAGCGKPMYTARTTLMAAPGGPGHGIKGGPDAIVKIGSSQKVLNASIQTLEDLGLQYQPEELLPYTAIFVEPHTNIVAIEVTLPDGREAKVAADVIAAEIKKAYTEDRVAAARRNRESLEARTEDLRKRMHEAKAALDRHNKAQKGVRAEDADLAAFESAARAAARQYAAAKKKLEDATIKEQDASKTCVLRTISSATVHRAR